MYSVNWLATPPLRQGSSGVRLIAEVASMTRPMPTAGRQSIDCYIHFLLPSGSSRYARAVSKLSLIDMHRAQIRPAVPRRCGRQGFWPGCYFRAECRLTRGDKLRFLPAILAPALARVSVAEEASFAEHAWRQSRHCRHALSASMRQVPMHDAVGHLTPSTRHRRSGEALA